MAPAGAVFRSHGAKAVSWLIIFAGLFCFWSPVFAQDEASPAKELPVAGYDTTAYHPLFIQSKDGLFKFNLGMYAQLRYNMNWRSDTPDSVDVFTRGYNLARTRIFFEGDLTPKFYYHFRMNINPSGNFELIVAYLQWNISPTWNLRAGRQFMALGLEDWMYPQDLTAMEFSAHDFTFAIWSSFGIQARHILSDKTRFWLSVGNGVYGGRRTFPAPKDSDLMFTGRFEWNVKGSDWDAWGDMTSRRGRQFGMLLGLGAGQLFRYDQESLETDAKNGTQLNLDFSLTGNGFHFYSHGNATLLFFDEGVRENYVNYGFYTSFGYWIKKHWFGYVRYDLVSAGSQPGAIETYASPGIGLSYYPLLWTNRLRFTAEYNFLGATVNNTLVQPDGQLGLIASDYGGQQHLRFQLQFGF